MATKKAQSKGGHARALAMSPIDRRASARKAALERWSKEKALPKASHDGTIRILHLELPCAVLEDGTRVLTLQGLNTAFGSRSNSARVASPIGSANFPPFLASRNVGGFISPELLGSLATPIVYRPKGQAMAYGYEASQLPLMCEAILDAKKAGVLQPSQLRLADAAEILQRALARVGIIALVDEATGYQADRARNELQLLLEKFVVEEMRPWVQLFPNTFFKGIYKVYGWQYREGSNARPQVVGQFINRYVYGQLPPIVLDELKSRNPVTDGGRRRHKHHQFLTEDIGIPPLDRHLAVVTMLMTLANGKEEFKELFAKAFPKRGDQTLMAFPSSDEE
jgi:hypothetical protein